MEPAESPVITTPRGRRGPDERSAHGSRRTRPARQRVALQALPAGAGLAPIPAVVGALRIREQSESADEHDHQSAENDEFEHRRSFLTRLTTHACSCLERTTKRVRSGQLVWHGSLEPIVWRPSHSGGADVEMRDVRGGQQLAVANRPPRKELRQAILPQVPALASGHPNRLWHSRFHLLVVILCCRIGG